MTANPLARSSLSRRRVLRQAGMEKGRVAIFDATNVSRKFRCEMVEELRSVVQVNTAHPRRLACAGATLTPPYQLY
jgi:hypothetical protein